MKLATFLILSYLGLSSAIHAQSSLTISGQEAQGLGGTASISIGQPFFQYHTDNKFSLTEGLQQTYIVSSVFTEDAILSPYQIRIFPNPTQHMIFIETDLPNSVSLEWIMSDMKGATLKSGILANDSREITLNELAAGTYFLQLMDKKYSLKVFKIVKTN